MATRRRVQHVLRVRRHQPTRLESFVDASFAFAVTLVVISIGHVPDSVAEMLQALRGLPTFAVCFVLIARIWKSHRDWSRVYDLEDGITIVLSLALVFLVLVYVYPLRLLFALMFASIGGGWLTEQVVDVKSYFELRAAFVVFSAGYAAIWCVFILLYRHAWKRRDAIGLDAAEVVVTASRVRLMIAFCGVSLLSVVLAATLPFATQPWCVQLPGSAYLLMIPIARWINRQALRRVDALSAAGHA